MHPLVERQIRRFFKGQLPEDPAVQAFVEAVSAAYAAADEDARLLERTLALASAETEQRNRALLEDIERRERAETERDAFFRTSHDMMAIVDAQWRLAQTNDSWTRLLGYAPEELQRLSLLDLVHPEDHDRLRKEAARVAQQGSTESFECRQRHKNGSWRWVSLAGSYDFQQHLFYVVSRDVTEQRNMARELAQSQKLEAVGQLASGVAHEINTPVQYVGDNIDFVSEGFEAVFGYLDLVRGLVDPASAPAADAGAEKFELEYFREELPRSLKEAREGVRRVAELVRALKEFAHPDSQEKAPADINRTLERAITLARGETKHICRVETDFAELPSLRCHIGSLSQVFLNLLVNAAHAVDERAQKEGTPFELNKITVRTRFEDDEIRIAFSDTGAGIPEAIRDRIFEPFFTTKPMGKGSGQGLPLVRNVIVSKHGGRISLESQVGVGTTFVLHLPVELDAADPQQRAA